MWLLERRPSGAPAPAIAAGLGPTTSGAGAVRCAACGHAITTSAARIEVAGRHEHTCMNPGGWVYRIACYRLAQGCAVTGEPSTEWSWFEGCAWQIALCAACRAHLGWRFSGPESFFGLIGDRVALDPGGAPGA